VRLPDACRASIPRRVNIRRRGKSRGRRFLYTAGGVAPSCRPDAGYCLLDRALGGSKSVWGLRGYEVIGEVKPLHGKRKDGSYRTSTLLRRDRMPRQKCDSMAA
jgi:hypothetical protein